MKEDRNTKKLSKKLIILWAFLLIVFVTILMWATISPMTNQDSEMAAPIELELPDPVPVEEHILKDEKQKAPGDSASIAPPIGFETESQQIAQGEILENSEHGLIPMINPENEKPRTTFAAQHNLDLEGKMKVAFIFTDLGRNQQVLDRILNETPPQVTLAFLPYSGNTKESIAGAKSQGHEVLLTSSMEPSDYPSTDPGPQTLLTGLNVDQNLDRLHWVMSQGKEYVGLINLQGSLFMSSHKDLHPILEDLHKRGLVFVEAVSTFRSQADEIAAELKMPYLRSHFVISESLTPKELHSLLIRAEQMAEQTPLVVIVAHASPRTIPLLTTWIKKAQEQNFAFVPVSQAIQIAAQTATNGSPQEEVSS